MAKKREEMPSLLGKITNETKKQTIQKASEKQRQRERLAARAAYDLTAEMKDTIKRRAYFLGIPASQLALFLLADGLQRLDAGEIDPTPYLEESTSPKFRHNLAFDDWYHLDNDD